MKILVFDDSELNRKGAEVFLRGHELTIVGTYDEAQNALRTKIDRDGLWKAIESKIGKSPAWNSEERKPWEKKKSVLMDELLEQFTTRPQFDVVLTDLMVLPSTQNLAQPDKFVGQEMPLGTTIALLALWAGVKKVAVVTNANHHSNPASAALDVFDSQVAGIGDAKLLCTNNNVNRRVNKETFEDVREESLDEVLKGLPVGPERSAIIKNFSDQTMFVKDWSKALNSLLS